MTLLALTQLREKALMDESKITKSMKKKHTGKFVPVKRFRGQGKPHSNVKPPFIVEPRAGKGIGSPPNQARPTLPWELPKGY